jgi:predicted TIM-barrel fold metal-dependent hydrolase
MAKYANLWADISARSGYNAITREPQFGVEFLDQFQDKLLFGTDYVINRDRPDAPAPIVGYFKSLLEHKKLSESAYRKIGWENAQRLLGL